MATATSYRTPGTLPPQTTGFVGRTAELGRARELLRASRLVTVTGPGGVGKTRLAVRVAGERTAWLFGAATPLWERIGRWYTGSPTHEALHHHAERVARGGLGDDRFWELHTAGAGAPLDHVIERALDNDDQLGEPAERP